MSMFQKATKEKAKLRMAIIGPAGGGKTYTALAVAKELGKRVALIDTEGGENGSANKYADRFDFDHAILLPPFHPQKFIDAIHEAECAGYDVLIIDSLTHAWSGSGGVLDQADAIAKRMRTSNSFAAWKEATPLQKSLIDTILQSKIHIICTMRSKMEYVLQVEERQGRTYQVPKKVGMAPIQRDDVQYEFDVVGDMDNGTMIVTKTRCFELTEAVIRHPGEQIGKTLHNWLSSGNTAAPKSIVPEPKPNMDPVCVPGPEQDPGAGGNEGYAEPPEEKPFWSTEVAIKLRNARSVVEHALREKDPEAKFNEDNTRQWLADNYGLKSHKDMTEQQYEALRAWMLRCHAAKEIVQ